MADFFWVGGSGTWDSTSTTNWASTSGGSGGAGVPTSADNAYFDGSSDTGAAFTVTLGTGAVCKDVIIGDGTTVSVLDQTMTLAGTATWDIYGSLFFPATSLTRTFTGQVRFLATTTGNTVTTNGAAGLSWTFNSPTGGWTLGSSLTSNPGDAQINIVTALFFDTAGFNISAAGVLSSQGFDGIRNIYLRGSTISGNRFFGAFWDGANTFVDAGTSTIRGFNSFRSKSGQTFHNVICEGGNSQFFNPNSATFNSVTFVDNYAVSTAFSTNDLTLPTPSSAGLSGLSLAANITVTGTFYAQQGNTDPTRRYRIASNVQGTPRTITAAAIDFGAGLDFEDITAAGAAIPWDVSTKQAGNCGGNTDITFPAAKTVYWNLAGTQNWSATGWATSSGGTPAAANFPLVQDTVVFDNNSAVTRVNINARYLIGTLDFTGRTTGMTFSGENVAPQIYGDFLLSSAITLTGNTTVNSWTFRGRGVQNIRSAGIEFVKSIDLISIGTLRLLDNLTTATSAFFNFRLYAGTLDLNNFDIKNNFFSSPGTTAFRRIDFGTGRIIGRNTIGIQQRGIDAAVIFTGSRQVIIENCGDGTLSTSQRENEPDSFLDVTILGLAAGATRIQLSDSGCFRNFVIADGVNIPVRLGQVRNIFSGSVTIPASVPAIQQFDLGASGIPGGIDMRGPDNATLTLNGQSIPGYFDARKSTGATLTLGSDVTTPGGLQLVSGTLNLNGKKFTALAFSNSNSNTRTLAMNNGTLELTGSGATVFNTATATSFTVTGNGTISMTSASAKTFAGGGYQNYPTLNQGGAGNLTITGANKFYNLTNSVQPATVIFPANTVTKVRNFRLRGTPGNLVTLQSSTAGQRFTLTYEP
jgi:hypothetical protein